MFTICSKGSHYIHTIIEAPWHTYCTFHPVVKDATKKLLDADYLALVANGKQELQETMHGGVESFVYQTRAREDGSVAHRPPEGRAGHRAGGEETESTGHFRVPIGGAVCGDGKMESEVYVTLFTHALLIRSETGFALLRAFTLHQLIRINDLIRIQLNHLLEVVSHRFSLLRVLITIVWTQPGLEPKRSKSDEINARCCITVSRARSIPAPEAVLDCQLFVNYRLRFYCSCVSCVNLL